jgi:5-methylcytosine-specific restriction endonuclease McrA
MASVAVKQTDPFYFSKIWRAVRRVILRRDGYRCTVCRANVAGKGEARVDHIKPRSTHPDLEYELSNLRTLCTTCDNQGHREKRRGHGAPRSARFAACNVRGEPFDPSHPWNRTAVK